MNKETKELLKETTSILCETRGLLLLMKKAYVESIKTHQDTNIADLVPVFISIDSRIKALPYDKKEIPTQLKVLIDCVKNEFTQIEGIFKEEGLINER